MAFAVQELAAAVIGSPRVEQPPAGPPLAILGSLLAGEERHPELLHEPGVAQAGMNSHPKVEDGAVMPNLPRS